MAFVEDLAEFFDTEDGFADEATIDGNNVDGILKEEDAGEPVGTESIMLTFVCAAAGAPDLPAGREGVPVVVNGTNYTTHRKEVQNGLAYYLLEEES
ncbi:MAG: hypothetical protein HQ519_00100 [Planctomycetes bacterium]|nr:hypothetical protein [Planctomycetota bacterium]